MYKTVKPQLPKTPRPRRLRPFDDEDVDHFSDFNAKSVEGKIDHFIKAIDCYKSMRMFETTATWTFETTATRKVTWWGFVRGMRYQVRDWQYMLKVLAKELALHDSPGAELEGAD